MIGLFRKATTPVGIDLGARTLRAMQLHRVGGRWAIHAATAFALPDCAADQRHAVGRVIADTLRRQGFRGRRIVLAAPHAILHTDLVELPPLTTNAPIDQLARMELVRMHRMEPASFEMAAFPTSPMTAGRGLGLLTVSCPHAPASQLLDDIECDGLTALAMEPEACALDRVAALAHPAGKDQPRLILSLGWTAARFFALRAGSLLYQRNLEDIGIARLHADLAKSLGADHDAADYLWRRIGLTVGGDVEIDLHSRADLTARIKRHAATLGEELNTSLAYLQHAGACRPDSAIFLCGQGALLPGLVDAVRSAARRDVHLLLPRLVADPGNAAAELANDPGMTAALGLALREEEGRL